MSSKRNHYNPFFFVKEALVSFWRHRVMSIAAILVLASCLFLLGVFYMLIINLNVNLEKLQLLNEIVVFTDPGLTQDQVDDLAADIQALDNVKYIEYTSKADGLESMKETYSEYGDLFDEIIANGDNPLSDSFTVTYKDNSRVYELEYALQTMPGITKINNRSDYAQKVESFKNGMSAVFVWLFVLLFAVSLFVIFNTIKIAVHGRKTEIGVMRFIGATKGFIISPFVIEGAFIGLLASGIAFLALDRIYVYVAKKIAADMQMLTVLPFADSRWLILAAFAVIGIVSGIGTSLISLSRSLNK